MPPRRQQPKPAQKHELEAFAEKYDTLALIHGDPVEVVFQIMGRAAKGAIIVNEDGTKTYLPPDDELALKSADTLMGYRYPKVKASELDNKSTQPLVFNVTMAPPAPKEISVNEPPRRPVLVIGEKT